MASPPVLVVEWHSATPASFVQLDGAGSGPGSVQVYVNVIDWPAGTLRPLHSMNVVAHVPPLLIAVMLASQVALAPGTLSLFCGSRSRTTALTALREPSLVTVRV